MTTINIFFSPLEEGVTTPGTVKFTPKHTQPGQPVVQGAQVLISKAETFDVQHGQTRVEVPGTGVDWYYEVRGQANGYSFKRDVLVPPNGTYDFESLERFDPRSGLAYEPEPVWWQRVRNIEKLGGIPGTPGDSAYERAVAQGYSGTELEWLAQLRGPQGIQGERGLRGVAGPAGEGVPSSLAAAGMVIASDGHQSTRWDYPSELIMDATEDSRGLMPAGTVESLRQDARDYTDQRIAAGFVEREQITSGDWNAIQTPGWYSIFTSHLSSVSNSPPTRQSAVVKIIQNPSGFVEQTAVNMFDPSDMWVRSATASGTNWRPWARVLADDGSGWVDLTPIGRFRVADQSAVQIRRSGNIVQFKGAITPSSRLAGGFESYVVLTVPAAYRPSGISPGTAICQGSSRSTWLAQVLPDGSFMAGRYGSGSSYQDNTPGNWMPFDLSWIV